MVTLATADTNKVSLFLAQEHDDCWGEEFVDPPAAGAAKYYELKFTGESVIHNKETVVSEVIRADRMRDSLSEVGVSVEGDLNFELVFRDMDILIETVMAQVSSFILERTFAAADVAVTASTNSFDPTAGTFADFAIGGEVWITLANAAGEIVQGPYVDEANNGRFITNSIATADLVVEDAASLLGNDLVDEAAAGITVTAKTNATTPAGSELSTTAPSTYTFATLDPSTLYNLEVGQLISFSGFVDLANIGL